MTWASVWILLLLVIATEAVTEILTTSDIFDPVRQRIKRWVYTFEGPPPVTYYQSFKVFCDKLIGCGYCTSAWVAVIICFITRPYTVAEFNVHWTVYCFGIGIIVHRLSNMYHIIFQLLKKGRVEACDLEVNLGKSTLDTVQSVIMRKSKLSKFYVVKRS